MSLTETEREHRPYPMTDIEFITLMRSMRLSFIDFVADFTAYDATLDLAFATAWDTAMNEAEAFPNDFMVLAEQQEYEGYMQQQQQVVEALMAHVEHAVKMAWPGNKRKLKEFGLLGQAARIAARSPSEYAMWAMVAAEVMPDYATELAATGLPATVQPALKPAALLLIDREVAYEKRKRNRLKATDTRHEKFEAIYSRYQRISSVAKRIYKNEEGKRVQFLLPWPERKKGE